MKINKIKSPKNKIKAYDLCDYFESCGYPGEKDNMINGYAWTLYLISKDYKDYIKNPTEEIRTDLKKQIKTLLLGGENYYTEEDIWNELSTKEKEERLNGTDTLPEGWFNWNSLSLDDMVEYLRNKYKFSSSGDALCIYRLIEFYDKNKKQND